MTINKIATALLLVFCILNISFADIDRDDPEEYGIGILTCPYATTMLREECFRSLFWLKSPVELYANPEDNAEVTGTILDPEEELQGWQPFHFWSAEGEVQELQIVEVGYEERAIVVYEQSPLWLRTGKGWLRKSDVRLNGSTVFLPWDIVLGYQLYDILEDGKPYIGSLYPLVNQPVFDAPGGEETGASISMGTLQNNNRPGLLVLNRQDNWIEVTIDNIGTTCGRSDQQPDGPTGWVQLTNENDNPNVYWYTRGC